MSIAKHFDELKRLTNSIDFKSFLSEPQKAKKYIDSLGRFSGNKELPSFICYYDVTGIDFNRAVSYKKDDEEYTKISEFWYPDPIHISNVGRANFIGQQVFYCADQSATALFETKPQEVGSKIGLMTFNLKRNLKLLSFGMFKEGDFERDQSIEFSEKEKAINTFFAEKFKEDINFKNDHLYYPTAIITNYFWPGDIDGIIFPSVAANGKGDNVVLKTEVIDTIHLLKEFRIFELTEFNSPLNFKVKCISVSNSAKNNVIEWSDIICSGHRYDESLFHY